MEQQEPSRRCLEISTFSQKVQDAHRWDIFTGKLVGRVGDEQARLADGAVPNDDTFDRMHGGREPYASKKQTRILLLVKKRIDATKTKKVVRGRRKGVAKNEGNIGELATSIGG